MQGLPYIKIFSNLLETLNAMDDAMAGRLFKAVLQYANGTQPQLSGGELFVFLMLKTQMDRDRAEYEEKRAAMSENGAKGGRPKKEKANGLEEKPKKQKVSEESKKSKSRQEKEYKNRRIKEKEEDIYNDVNDSKPDSETTESNSIAAYAESNLEGVTEETIKDVLRYRIAMPEELIREAITETLRHGGHTIAYVLSVLENWSKAGYKSVEDWRAAENARKAARNAPARPMLRRGTPEDDGFTDSITEIMARRLNND